MSRPIGIFRQMNFLQAAKISEGTVTILPVIVFTEPIAAQDFRQERESRWLLFRCRKQQKQPAAMPLPLTLARLVATGPVPACPHPSALPHAGEGGTPVSGRGCGAYRSRSLGSRASRKASPKRLKPKTVRAIARPGKIAIHGAVEAYSSAPPCSIRPQAGTGSCTPSPR